MHVWSQGLTSNSNDYHDCMHQDHHSNPFNAKQKPLLALKRKMSVHIVAVNLAVFINSISLYVGAWPHGNIFMCDQRNNSIMEWWTRPTKTAWWHHCYCSHESDDVIMLHAILSEPTYRNMQMLVFESRAWFILREAGGWEGTIPLIHSLFFCLSAVHFSLPCPLACNSCTLKLDFSFSWGGK